MLTMSTRRRRRHLQLHGSLLWCLLLVACGRNDEPDEPRSPDTEPPKTESPSAPTPEIRVAANDAMIRGPLDATPSPDGKRVFYTAVSHATGEPQPGVFGVAASGGEVQMIALGEPFVAPASISISLDGSTLFVADPAAGAIFRLPADGGTPSVLSGTGGYAPAGLVVAKVDTEYVYFTGRNPAQTEAGLFRVASEGGNVDTVASGAPFQDPAGVAIDSRGDAYVIETGPDNASAQVVRVRKGVATTFVDGIGVGFPAGVTLTHDDATLLVSGLDPQTRRDVVYFVDTASAEIAHLTDTVGAFAEPAGLHRAHDADVFAWADSEAREYGTVFVLEP
jgi:catechol 2,3-dioxygenase-like lactoylglutathione lyase family enzyme